MSKLEKQLSEQPWRTIPAEWRREILATAQEKAAMFAGGPASGEVPVSISWWRLVFCSSPRAWTAMAAAWLLMGLALVTMPSVDPPNGARVQAGISVIAEAWREQKQLLAELLPGPGHIEPPREPLPRRRSDCEAKEYFV